MSRAVRLLALADLLRSREATTVDALASELEVSRRTLLRDLATLREQGMPIRGEPGRGGGIRNDDRRGIAAVHLRIDEVVALWLAARLSREATDLPWGGAARSALDKLLASLPHDRARDLRSLCRRVVVGPLASPSIRAGARRPPAELLGLFEQAFSAGLGLAFDYTDRDECATTRSIEPHGLLVEPPVWYVLARDIAKGAPRTFRMDRIARPRLLRDARFRPDLAIVRGQVPDATRWRPLLP